MKNRFAILGGTGTAGVKIAELLLKHTNATVVLLARNRTRIEETINRFEKKYSIDRISGLATDANSEESLLKAFKHIDMIIVASGTAELVGVVVQAALKANIDYLDIQYSSKKIEVLKSYKKKIEQQNKLYITDAGFHPGLPAALVRLSEKKLNNIESSVIYSAIKQDWRTLEIGDSTKVEFVQELNDYESQFFCNGKWQTASMFSTKYFKRIDFDEPLGNRLCAPMRFEELKNLPETIPSLKETGFYIAGFNWFIDMIIMPISLVWQKVFKKFGIRTIAKMMFRSLVKNSKPPFQTALILEAQSGNNEIYRLKLYHEDGYWFTAIPVVACLKQYIEGRLPGSGLYCMGNIVEPLRIIDDMRNMGIKIEEF